MQSFKKYWKLGTRFPENFHCQQVCSFLSQVEDDCLAISAKRPKFFDSSILLIIILSKLEGFANIMSNDCLELIRILHSSEESL